MAKPKKAAVKKSEEIVLTLQEVPSSEIDLEQIKSDITREVSEKLTAEFEKKLNSVISEISKSSEQRRDRIVLTSEKQYFVDATSDGLSFNKDNDLCLLIGKNGQVATGTRSPRTVGKGSLHIKAGAPSEAVVPSTGLHSTRGAIIEGDGDDDKTYALRVLSRMNRQGVNVFSDGSLSLGSMNKISNGTFSVYHKLVDTPAAVFNVPSLQFEDDVLRVQVDASVSTSWKVFTAKAGDVDVAEIDGQGSVFSNETFHSNNTGYAEMFEWADGNSRNENRLGFTVTLDKNGKILSADEGDNAIGVIVARAAFLGNSAWNHWQGRFSKNDLNEISTEQYNIIEWLENETTTLKSYSKYALPDAVSLPDNALEIQTDKNGNPFKLNKVDKKYDTSKSYEPRTNRNAWATVCVLGVAPVYKGQQTGKNWIKIRSLTDEVELWLIK